MSTERRPAGPTVYGERRHSDEGVSSVVLDVCAISGAVTLVGVAGAASAVALVPELLGFANMVLRNPIDAVAVEIVGAITIQVHGSLGVAIDDDGVVTMAATNKLTVTSESRRRPRYLAIAGGIDPHLGTQAPGRALVVGQTLRPGGRRGLLVGGPGRAELRLDEAIGVRPGPAGTPGAFEVLARTRCKMDSADRVALRLTPSSAIPAGAAVAAPVTRGAVLLSSDGSLLVAGPDHPAATQPVIAFVDEADLGRLAAHAAGSSVTFAPL